MQKLVLISLFLDYIQYCQLSFFFFLKTGTSWPGAYSIDQADLKLRGLPASASQVLELKVTMLGLTFNPI